MEQLDQKKRSLTQTILFCIIAASVVVLVLIRIETPCLLEPPEEARKLVIATASTLLLSLVLLAVNRRYSVLASIIVLTFITISIGFADTPEHVVVGSTILYYVLPIVISGVLIRPWASFAYAGLAGLIVFLIGYTSTPQYDNWVAIVGFFVLAAVVWVSARTLEGALHHSLDLAAALADSEQRYRGIFEHSLSGIGLHKLIRDEEGTPIDYRFTEINSAFEEQTGLANRTVVGHTALETIPGVRQAGFIDTYGHVVDSGEPISFAQYVDALERTYDISAFSVGQDQFVTIFSDVSERVRYDQERELLLADMQRQADELHSVIEAVPVAVLMLSENRRVVMANALAETLLADIATFDGDKLASLAGQPLIELLHGPALRYWQPLSANDRLMEATVRSVDEGSQAGWALVVRDVTQEREFERRLQQQDRLAVIGQLAGGIAHDFNNLLTTILGFSDFALDAADPGSTMRDDIAEVRAAALRAAALTQQLLAFSRRQMLQPRTVSLCDVVGEMRRMLGGLLEETIALTFEMTPCADTINVDPVQVQQVVMNLAVNARDAMPDGGRMTIAVQGVTVEAPPQAPHRDVPPGEYVVLSVADSGVGMTEKVQQHLFEPFFTTKDVGKGTGLGLATVYGIVRQSEGHISVESAEGEGTTFRVYFPPADTEHEHDDQSEQAVALPRGDEVILLVEDEAAVRRLARRELESLGYVVLEAERPSVALALSRAAKTIDLLLTDVVMPEMDGTALASEIRKQRANLHVLYVSGYTDRDLDQIVTPESGARFMEKPYRVDELATMVRVILDEP